MASPSELPPVLDVEQAAGLLGCEEDRVRAEARKLGGLKFGRDWVFPAAAFFKRLNEMAERTARLEPARQAKVVRRRPLVRHHAAKRRAARLLRTPPWSDLAAIRAIYNEAARRTAETGVVHHVDHEIPLQGKLVSGLHVAGNLQILTGTENVRKHNRFEPS